MNEHERRRLFFAAMRRPEMRLVRLALHSLLWNAGVDWRTIRDITLFPPETIWQSWFMTTGQHLVIDISPMRNAQTWDDFSVYALHVADDPGCTCDVCAETGSASAA